MAAASARAPTTVSLRNLGAKRTLILVDGLRWVNESSASGVSAAVDLNTIPVEHRRSHRDPDRRRIVAVRLRRDRRRGQHHHQEEGRRARLARLRRRLFGRRRQDLLGQRLARRQHRSSRLLHGHQPLQAERHQLGRLGAVALSDAGHRRCAESGQLELGDAVHALPVRHARRRRLRRASATAASATSRANGVRAARRHPAVPRRLPPFHRGATVSTSRRTTCC